MAGIVPGIVADLQEDNRVLREAVLAYLSEMDNPVPDALHRRTLRNHLRKLVDAPPEPKR